jgi:hypothetical protein
MDPDAFDEESFTPLEDSTAQKDIFDIIGRINKIKDKIQEINSL